MNIVFVYSFIDSVLEVVDRREMVLMIFIFKCFGVLFFIVVVVMEFIIIG